jgi:uncharacterized protein (DUF1499 family)
MRLILLALALLLPACSDDGPAGVPPPPPLDMAKLQRTAQPIDALAAPPEFRPAPDIFTRGYAVDPDRLYAAVRQMARAQPRTWVLAAYDDRRQIDFVARDGVLHLPDIVTVQVTPDSQLIMWSRSRYGFYDFNANLKRLETWQAALAALLPQSSTLPAG